MASADYDSFYKVMAREGARSVTMKGLLKSSPKKDAKDGPVSVNDIKAEIKRSTPNRSSDDKSTAAATAAASADDKYAGGDGDDAPSEKKSYK